MIAHDLVAPERHVVVVAAPDALPDPGAALQVFDGALRAWGLTGELVLTGSADEVRDTVAWATAAGREPVVLPGLATDLDLAPDDDVAPDGATVLRVDLDDRPRDPSPRVRRHLRGRGLEGLRFAVDTWVLHRTQPAARRAPLRDRPRPARRPPPAGVRRRTHGHRVAVLVHGGYWRSRWESDLMEPLAAALADRGWATWNVEYRRPDDHTWDATTADVTAALAALAHLTDPAPPNGATGPASLAPPRGAASRADLTPPVGTTAPRAPLDLSRVVLIGHSAGGQLVTRLAADVAADPAARVRPALTVSLAGVLDLVDADRRRLGDGAVAQALGGTADAFPDVYRAASPVARVPVGCPLTVVCALDDELARPEPHLRARRERGRGRRRRRGGARGPLRGRRPALDDLGGDRPDDREARPAVGISRSLTRRSSTVVPPPDTQT